MDNNNLDKVEKVLASVSLHTDYSLLDASSVFAEAESACGVSTPAAASMTTDSFGVALRDSLALKDTIPNDSKNQSEPESSLSSRGVAFISDLRHVMETIVREKDNIRQQLKLPIKDNSLPVHYDHHRSARLRLSCRFPFKLFNLRRARFQEFPRDDPDFDRDWRRLQ